MEMKNRIEELWVQFANKLKAFIISKVHDETVADDILQEAFIKIHAKIDTLKDETKIQSWIYQITRNLITDHFRAIKKTQKAALVDDKEEENDIADFMTESIQDMINMMEKLPSGFCEALCLTELDAMSQKQYAEKIGISYSAAKSRVQRARKMLKDMLMNCCHYQFDKYGTVLGIHPADCCCCEKEHHH